MAFRDRHHAKYRIHRSPDIVGHGRKKLSLCLTGLLRQLCSPAKTLVYLTQIKSVQKHQCRQRSTDQDYDQPGAILRLQLIQPDHTKDIQIGIATKGRIIPQTVLIPEIFIAEYTMIGAFQFFLETVHLVVIILEIIAPNIFRKRN